MWAPYSAPLVNVCIFVRSYHGAAGGISEMDYEFGNVDLPAMDDVQIDLNNINFSDFMQSFKQQWPGKMRAQCDSPSWVGTILEDNRRCWN